MMQLSDAYKNVELYAIVYHTGLGPDVVELVASRFFKSKKKAWNWFEKKYKYSDFLEPECVLFTGFNHLMCNNKTLAVRDDMD